MFAGNKNHPYGHTCSTSILQIVQKTNSAITQTKKHVK